MDPKIDMSDILDESDSVQDVQINFPDSVLSAIEEFLPNADQLDSPDFNTINYINMLFPTEQSLSNIDNVVSKMEYKISTIDEEIQDLVRGQNVSREDGQKALEEAQRLIKELSVQVRDINKKAEKSEEMVKEITSEIKQLDCAKINLTAAITTLNHLHMLVGGMDNLKTMTEKHYYKEVVLPLQAIMEVLKHFENYKDIKLINDLRYQMFQIRSDLAKQIMADFREAFTGSKSNISNKSLCEACLVVTTLDAKVKDDLLKWFIGIQLQEYVHLFSSNQDTAWLDKVDKRYAWIKKHLIKFEETLGSIFPQDWEVSELIVIEFCKMTKEELSKIMAARRQEIDVKLLLYAIQKTYNFETLLDKRFTGVTLKTEDPPIQSNDNKSTTHKTTTGSTESQRTTSPLPIQEDKEAKSPFVGLIGTCFEPYLYLYIESLDTNLADLMERFIQDSKQASTNQSNSVSDDLDSSDIGNSSPGSQSGAAVLSSCADLFLFYKKCMVQCTQLTTGQPMLGLTVVFQKYLREYAVSVLQATLPKHSTGNAASNQIASLGSQVSSITRDLQNLSTSGLIQNFQSFLKEGDTVRFTKAELSKITSVISTAEYCLETTVHLEQKLKEKVSQRLSEKIDLSQEQELFHKIISNSIQLLVQDLEFACEPSLSAMTKIQWQNVDAVGDQSSYVSQVITHLKTTVPIIRDNLSSSRKYFTQFCIKFASSFIPKFIQNIYKCKPLSTVGSEQLLLDTHMLKTVLLDLPSIGSQVKRQPPTTYTKVVIKSMTKAEMVLKLVMSPLNLNSSVSNTSGSMENFVEQFVRLLPECSISEFHKVLDMKGVKANKAQITAWDHVFKMKTKEITAEK